MNEVNAFRGKRDKRNCPNSHSTNGVLRVSNYRLTARDRCTPLIVGRSKTTVQGF